MICELASFVRSKLPKLLQRDAFENIFCEGFGPLSLTPCRIGSCPLQDVLEEFFLQATAFAKLPTSTSQNAQDIRVAMPDFMPGIADMCRHVFGSASLSRLQDEFRAIDNIEYHDAAMSRECYDIAQHIWDISWRLSEMIEFYEEFEIDDYDVDVQVARASSSPK